MFEGLPAGASRRVLTWAVGTPFFVMPLPLTLLAWDLYGGFAVHAKLALGLTLLGALVGIAVEVWRARTPKHPAETVGSHTSRSTTDVALLLLLSQALVFGGIVIAPGIARLLMLWAPGQMGQPDSLAARGAFSALVVLAGLRVRDEHDGARFGGSIAAAWLLLIASQFAVLALGWPPWTRPVVVGIGAAALLLRPPGPALGRHLARLGPAVCIGAIAWLLLNRAPEVLFHMDPRPVRVRAVVGALAAVVVVGLFLLLPRKPWLLATLRRVGAAADAAAGATVGALPSSQMGVLALLSGLALAVLSLPLATLGGLCGELSIPLLGLGPEPMGPVTVAGPSLVGDLGLFIGLLRLGMVTRDGAQLRRLLRWGGAAFLLCALAGVGAVQAPGLRSLADLLLLVGGIAPWLPMWWRVERFERLFSLPLALAPVPALAVGARYVAAAFPLVAEPDTLARVGALMGLGVGVALTRLKPRPGQPASRVLFLALAGLLALALLIYIGVFFAMAPFGFLACITALTAALVVSRARSWRARGWIALPSSVALWLLFYSSFSAVVVFKEGPGPGTCAPVIAATEARVLLDRFGEGGEYPTGDPYDLLPDPTGRWLVTTFKRFDHRGGWIEVIDLEDPSRRTRTSTKPTGDAPFWPERFVVHPETGRYYFGMLGIGAYELWEMELRGEPGAVPRIEKVRSRPMIWEPSYPDIDVPRGVLVQSYLSAGIEKVEREQPLVHRFDLDEFEPGTGWSMGPEVQEMSEFVKVHPTSGDYYVPGYFNLVRFALIEIDGDTMQFKRRKETFHPTIALGFDASGERMFVTNSLGGTLDVYDVERFERTATVRSGAFPRDLVVDAEAQRVYVGNYSSGTVIEFDVSEPVPRRIRSVTVGPLLRGIGIHEASGAVYAASACGVFEINGARR